MDIKVLAEEAASVMYDLPYSLSNEHGIEVAPGFFNIYNRITGQSRDVLYHPETDLIFKTTYASVDEDTNTNSKKILGHLDMYGKIFTVRFPLMFMFLTKHGSIEVQEYVRGASDPCLDTPNERGFTNAWCEHAQMVRDASGLSDTHTGNWKMLGNEIIIFDW